MGDARLRASLELDPSRFSSGIDGAVQKTRGFQSQIETAERKLGSMSKVSNGVASLLRGDFANGIRGVTVGLREMTGATDAALGGVVKLGGALAALAIGWKAGKFLDDKLGLSDIIASKFRVRPGSGEAERMRKTRVESEDVAGIDAETLAIARRNGGELVKLEERFERDRQDIKKRLLTETRNDARAALQAQMQMLEYAYKYDVEAFKRAEAEKTKEAKRQAEQRQRRAGYSVEDVRTQIDDAKTDPEATPERELNAEIMRRQARADALEKRVSDPTDSALTVTERELEIQQRILAVEQERAAVRALIKQRSEVAVGRELSRFFDAVDAPTRMGGTRFNRSGVESVGGQIGGASRADFTIAQDQLSVLRNIEAGIKELSDITAGGGGTI
jgi:hypothetical protein